MPLELKEPMWCEANGGKLQRLHALQVKEASTELRDNKTARFVPNLRNIEITPREPIRLNDGSYP